MRRAHELPEALRREAFDASRATDLGISRERLRRGDLARPFHGIRSVSAPSGPVELAHAYAPRLTAGGFFSHTTAAALWGLPLPPLLDTRVHVSQPHGRRPPRTRGVVGHHLVMRSDEITVLDGLPVTTPARTWCNLAGRIGREALIAAGDRVLWRHDPLATLEELYAMASRHPDPRGRAARFGALPLLSDRADSSPETTLRVRCLDAGCPPIAVNPLLRGPRGEWIGQPDLAFLDYREVLEYEGDGHRTSREQWLTDLDRVPRFEDFGWHVTRVGSTSLADGSRRLLGILQRRLREKGWTGELRL